MTKKVRFTYRLTEELYEKLAESAQKRNIAINSEINRILWDYFEKREQTESV